MTRPDRRMGGKMILSRYLLPFLVVCFALADSGNGTGSPLRSKRRHWSVKRREVPDEQRLLTSLLESYHMYSRPVYNASETVVIKFGLTLVQISDMDEVNQVLTINVWLEQEWQDERLVWDPSSYNGLRILRIPCEKIWLPDIVLYNSADDFTTGYMKSKAMVTSAGNVFWPPPAKFRSSCKIDITYFPFDDQVCELKFGSWTYDGFQVDITNRSDKVDLNNYVFSGEWELIDVRVRRTEMYYACCEEPYPDVRFTIIIRRKTLYYLFNIIFPCLWLSILSLLGFWLPPDSGEKITLGITVLLAFSVFMLLIAESMPATSEFVPLIGIYLTVTMAMTSLSIILTVFVLQLHHVGPHQKRVPGWVWTLVVDILAPLVCLCHISRRYRYLAARLKLKTLDSKHKTVDSIHEVLHSTRKTLDSTHQVMDSTRKILDGQYNHVTASKSNPRHWLNSVNCHGVRHGGQNDPSMYSPTDDIVTPGDDSGRGRGTCNGTLVSQHGPAAPRTSNQTVSIPNNIHSSVHGDGRMSQVCHGQEHLWLDERLSTPRESNNYDFDVQSSLHSAESMAYCQNEKVKVTKVSPGSEMLNPLTPNFQWVSEGCINLCGYSHGSTTCQCATPPIPSNQDVTHPNDYERKTGVGESLCPPSLPSSSLFRHAHIHQVTEDSSQDPTQGHTVLCTSQVCQQLLRAKSSPDMVYLQPEMNIVQFADCVQETGPTTCQHTYVKWQGGATGNGITTSLGTISKDFHHTTTSISERGNSTIPDVSGDSFHNTYKVNIEDVKNNSQVAGNTWYSQGGFDDHGKEPAAQQAELVSPSDKADYHQDIVTEWRVVAHVMDRLLFWLFLLISIVSSVLILVVRPINKPEAWRHE